MSIVVIDSEAEALTISWPKVEGVLRYKLEYRNANDDDDKFQMLSDKLTATQARKKNLSDESGNGFIFRVGSIFTEDGEVTNWVSHDEAFNLLPNDHDSKRMEAPKVSLGGTTRSARVSWKECPGIEGGYEIQMRENAGGAEWKTIAPSFSGLEVRKKNLLFEDGYQFRVRPAGGDDGAFPVFSPPSDVILTGLSSGMKRLFGSLEKGTLLKGNEPVSLEDALGGKEFVLLYASASWCGPCRNFTPQLANWYKSLPPNSPAEVIFVSADHNDAGFKGYYGHMPWLAIDFDDDTREQIMAHIRVSGIPRLAVLDSKGRIIEDNAVGKPFDISRWRTLAANK